MTARQSNDPKNDFILPRALNGCSKKKAARLSCHGAPDSCRFCLQSLKGAHLLLITQIHYHFVKFCLLYLAVCLFRYIITNKIGGIFLNEGWLKIKFGICVSQFLNQISVTKWYKKNILNNYIKPEKILRIRHKNFNANFIWKQCGLGWFDFDILDRAMILISLK